MDNFDLKKFVSEKTLLNENAPGYNTRKTGEALPTLESVKAAYEADMGEGELNEAPLMATNLDSEVYDRIDGLTNIKLLQELLDKAIQIQDDQAAAGDDFDTEDLALYLGMKILDVLK
jgi:hypothetical protein